MAVRQVLRGDPETKQYLVSDNFAGGINTTDIDDIVKDNEFRMLLNVELGKDGGMLKNRKGFGEMSLLSELLYDKGIDVPPYFDYNPSLYPNRPLMIRIVKNTNNAFAKFEQYDTLADYISSTSALDIKLHLLMNLGGTFYLLKIEKAVEASDFTASFTFLETVYRDDVFPWGASSEQAWGISGEVGGIYDISGTDSDDLPAAPVQGIYARVNNNGTYLYYHSNRTVATEFNDRIMSAEAVDFASYTYILGASLSPQAKNTLYLYDSDYESLTNIDKTVCYKPTPYEVVSGVQTTGFNVFAMNPLTYVKDQDIGLKSILGVFLTSTETGAYLTKIPSSGDFTVNVLQYGNTMTPLELIIKFRVGSTTSEKGYVLADWRDLGGIFQYDIEDLDVSGVSFFEIDVEKREDTVTVASEAVLDYVPFRSESVLVLAIASFNTIFSVDKIPANDGKVFELYDSFDNVRYAIYNDGTSSFDETTDASTKRLSAIEIGEIVHATSEDSYFFKIDNDPLEGNANYTPAGFNESETIVSLLAQVYDIGTTPNEQVIKEIDLSGARMMLVNALYSSPRMLYYKGNTLWFSEIGQFDYLPNVNFVMLPLDADDEIVSVNFYRNTYIIFTKTAIYKMKGDYEASDFSISLVNGNIGCVAPYSVRGINNALVFLSADGLYKLTANVYADEIENVSKIDKKINGLYTVNPFAESVLYGEKYVLFLKDNENDALVYYYNIGDHEHPFTVWKFQTVPTIVAKLEQSVVSLKTTLQDVTTGLFFVFDKGFLDFVSDDELETSPETVTPYTCKIVTVRNSLGYPTHNKKFKSAYLKTYYSGHSVVRITALVDDFIVVDPNTYKVIKNDDGSISYVLYDPNDVNSVLTLDLDIADLGTYELGVDPLGDNPFTIHKVIIGNKGATIQMMFEHSSNGQFGIASIGHVFKVGKIKSGV